MNTWLKENAKKAQSWLKQHSEIFAVVTFGIGTLLGLGIPLWSTYVVETPDLSIEIYAVKKEVSSDAVIPPNDGDLVALLNMRNERQALFENLFRENAPRKDSRKGLSPGDVRDLILSLKEGRPRLHKELDEERKHAETANNLTAEQVTMNDVDQLNFPLDKEIEVKIDLFDSPLPAARAAERERVVEFFKETYATRVRGVEQRIQKLQDLPEIERRLEDTLRTLEERSGQFKITAVVSNAGRSSISIRESSLFRVYVAKNKYADVRLSLDNYQTNAEISPKGARIVTFTSGEVSSFLDDDRTIISNFWGQSVNGLLFVEDISGEIHRSNPASFAEGFNKKASYDRLAAEASKVEYLAVAD